MSAESYAEQQFAKALAVPSFAARLGMLGVALDEVQVVDSSTPVGEVLAWRARVVAVCDEDAPQGFTLARITEVG